MCTNEHTHTKGVTDTCSFAAAAAAAAEAADGKVATTFIYLEAA